MTQLAHPETSEYYSIVSAAGDIVSSGRLEPTQVLHTASPEIIHSQSENDYLEQINVVGSAGPQLPAQGTPLEADVVYSWEGQNVIVRQDHVRTEHDPDTVPALFLVYRASGGDLLWIPNENIGTGIKRIHSDVTYEAIQPHVSVQGQSPDVTPALWNVVQGDWDDWVQPTGAHDTYALGDKVTHNDVRWLSNVDNNSWEPGVYGWDEV